MKVSKTVLITQRPGDMLDVMAQWLRDAGYRVRVCTGPSEVRYDCWAHKYDDCPLWHQADLVVYDPWLATAYGGHDHFFLEQGRHETTPILIWGPSAIPGDVFDLAQEGKVEILPLEITREVLLEAVDRNIGGPTPELVAIEAS
jgi:DNA-binding NtrC family response regulator